VLKKPEVYTLLESGERSLGPSWRPKNHQRSWGDVFLNPTQLDRDYHKLIRRILSNQDSRINKVGFSIFYLGVSKNRGNKNPKWMDDYNGKPY